MNELRRFKHSADFFANSSHIIESAAISASELSTLLTHTGYKEVFMRGKRGRITETTFDIK